ncbi:probable protein FAM98A [Coccomyxa sp. Obi]|nr:probable protein FAM98A [Coccomyxa sp. Obi]
MSRTDVLLERIAESWVHDHEMSERDITSKDATEPFLAFCTTLAAAVMHHVCQLPADSSGKVKAAVDALMHSASTNRSAKDGQLDFALQSLDKALDPASTARTRLEFVERLVAAVQSLRLLSISADSDKEMRAAPMPDVCEVSQQLCAIARLLEVDTGSEHAAPLLSAVNKRLPVMLQALPESFFVPLLPQGSLSADQVKAIEELDKDLRNEYRVRRQMLIERAKVLMQSFMRADRLAEEGLAEEAKALVHKYASSLSADPEVSLSSIFTARQADLVAVSSKASSGDKSRFVASVKQFNIGAVPNRGGVPSSRMVQQAGGRMPAKEFHKKCRLK